MPVQTKASQLAQKFGGRIAAANAEHKDKPLDLGFKRLPPGIRNGVGKLQTVAMKHYGQEEKIVALRGQEYLHVVGVVKSPTTHNGEKVEGSQMYQRFPLCDIPANPANKFSKPRSFSDNWYDFQQFFKRFGIDPPNENVQTDPTGQRTLAFYQAAIATLNTGDKYYEFSTRAWTPQGSKEERIEEEWGKQCAWNGQVDPGAGVAADPAASQPEPFTEPPTGQPQSGNGQPTSAQPAPTNPQADPADEVASLVETATGDPEGATEDGAAASRRLEEMAWAVGWTKEQTANPPPPFSNDWAGVGDMALTPPTSNPTPPTVSATPTASGSIPTVGSKHKFCKRTKDGAKLRNAKGEEFPPQEVEVTAVDSGAKLCTVKSTKDGKEVVDIKSKKPVGVKWEWLE